VRRGTKLTAGVLALRVRLRYVVRVLFEAWIESWTPDGLRTLSERSGRGSAG
jgi:hypothetical protein